MPAALVRPRGMQGSRGKASAPPIGGNINAGRHAEQDATTRRQPAENGRRRSLFDDTRRHGQQPLALELLARQLAGPAHGLGGLAGALLRRLLVMSAELHLPKDALALHLLLE